MSAPTTPPYYGDLLGGGEDGIPKDVGAHWVLSNLAAIARDAPEWVWEERDLPVKLWIISDLGRAGTEMGFLAGEVSGTIRLGVDESGYVRAQVGIGGQELMRLYVDRPYEEYEAHPPGAVFEEKRTADPPARMGKRATWLQLTIASWPALARLSDTFMTFSVKE